MAWSTTTTATQLTNVSSSETFFSETPTLNPGESAHVQIEVDHAAGDTVPAVINVYATVNGTTWDTRPILPVLPDAFEDPQVISFVVSGIYQFRVGIKAGSSTNLTSADMRYRLDQINIA